MKQKKIEIRSEEVQDIMSYVPHWMIRWGITLVAIIAITALLMSWVIKYPDTIKGSLTLVTTDPPVRIINPAAGKLFKLKAKNGDYVTKGTVIAEIENLLKSEEVLFLEEMVRTVQDEIEKSNPISIKAQAEFTFGELQSSYNLLIDKINNYNYHISNPYTKSRVQIIESKINRTEELVGIMKNQVQLNERNVKNGKEKFIINKTLFKEDAISKLSYLGFEDEYTAKLKELEDSKSSLINAKISLTELYDVKDKEAVIFLEKKISLINDIQTAIRNINNYIEEWFQKNIIVAPCDGELAYLKDLSLNQYVKSSEALFSIVPDGNEYVALIEVKNGGIGKVNIGQKVLVKLNNYPYKEFGQVIGRVKSISTIPNNNIYLIHSDFPNGLKTSYHTTLSYEPEMKGTAEIITKDLRLLERFINSVRGVME